MRDRRSSTRASKGRAGSRYAGRCSPCVRAPRTPAADTIAAINRSAGATRPTPFESGFIVLRRTKVLLAGLGQQALCFGEAWVASAVPEFDFAYVFVVEAVELVDEAVEFFLFVQVVGVARVGLLFGDET
ncbi:MAG TPA: hypothetical protein VGP08_15615 [Pyrinomonadaceae bacterium]|nr:hypothetical protein [Pyrinomonadaceae bacterium]